MIKILLKSISLVHVHQRRNAFFIFIAIVFSSLLDILGVAALFPVLLLVVNPEMLVKSTLVNQFSSLLGIESQDYLMVLLITVLLVLFVVKNFFGLYVSKKQSSFALMLATDLSARKYRYLFQQGYSLIRKKTTGDYISEVRNTPIFWAIGVAIPLMQLLSEMLVLGILLIGIFLYQPLLVLMLGIVAGGGTILTYRFTRKNLHQIGEDQKTIAPISIATVSELFHGFVDIEIFNKTDEFLRRYIGIQQRENDIQTSKSYYGLLPARANEQVMILTLCVLLLAGIFLSHNRDEFMLLMSVFAASAFRVMPSANRILNNLMSIRQHQYTLEELAPLAGIGSAFRGERTEKMPFHTSIEFEKLTFSFPDAVQPVLNEFTFSLRKGEQVGCIGESGSGKTTLSRLFLRLLIEQSGRIQVDGVTLNENNKDAWQQLIGYVAQNIFIFEGSILANLIFEYDISKADLRKAEDALRRSRLYDFVMTLPEGIHTPIGEDGSRLSGGQRQRLAIARALYKDAEIFVFDEATSALDPETEMLVTESIADLVATDKTVFIIAHRLTTLKGCDRVIEMQHGRVAREYSYPELLREKLGLQASE